MLKKIEALRKQPKHIRNRYAFWSAFFVTLVIIVVWGSTLPARFSPASGEGAPSEKTNWGSYKEALGRLYANTAERFGSITALNTQEEQAPERVDLVELVASSSVQTERVASSTASSTLPVHTSTTTASTSASSTPRND